jgi:hypothetical protein
LVMKHPFSLLILFPLLFHLYQVNKIKEPKGFDPLLKSLALSTFSISLVLFIIFSIFK